MFAVFGVTRAAARAKAEKKFSPYKDNRQRKTLEETKDELNELTDKYYARMAPIQLSCKYPSLKIAMDFVECTKGTPSRRVTIKKQIEFGTNPKTGKAKLKWVDI